MSTQALSAVAMCSWLQCRYQDNGTHIFFQKDRNQAMVQEDRDLSISTDRALY
jgi:hypothetical protein